MGRYYFFFNFNLFRRPAIPTIPDPRRSMDEGSGTGAVSSGRGLPSRMLREIPSAKCPSNSVPVLFADTFSLAYSLRSKKVVSIGRSKDVVACCQLFPVVRMLLLLERRAVLNVKGSVFAPENA